MGPEPTVAVFGSKVHFSSIRGPEPELCHSVEMHTKWRTSQFLLSPSPPNKSWVKQQTVHARHGQSAPHPPAPCVVFQVPRAHRD